MDGGNAGNRRYGAAPGITPGDNQSVLLVDQLSGVHLLIEALYVNWTDDMVNYLIVDGQLYGEPVYYDIGTPDNLQRQNPPIFCLRSFEVRSAHAGLAGVKNGEALAQIRLVHSNNIVPPSRVKVGPNKALRRRFMRRA